MDESRTIAPLAQHADARIVGIERHDQLTVVAHCELAHLTEGTVPGDRDPPPGLRGLVASGSPSGLPAAAAVATRVLSPRRGASDRLHAVGAPRVRHLRQVLLEFERQARELERLGLPRGGSEPVLCSRADVVEELLAAAGVQVLAGALGLDCSMVPLGILPLIRGVP